MPLNLPAHQLITLAIDDFETVWDTMANTPHPPHAGARGNFMFGKLAMTLLELACRACKSDLTGQAHKALTDSLNQSDPRYFHNLPGTVWKASKRTRKAFDLPSLPTNNKTEPRHVLAAIFNLVRNGQAHQYQQTAARLSDPVAAGGPKHFKITITGPHPGDTLANGQTRASRANHLSRTFSATEIWLMVLTNTLFCDIRDAVRAANLHVAGTSILQLRISRDRERQDRRIVNTKIGSS